MMPPQSIPSSGRQTRPSHYPYLQPATYNYALPTTTPFCDPVDAVGFDSNLSYLSPSSSPLSGLESSPSSTLHSVATPATDWPSLFHLDEPTLNPAALSSERVMQTEAWLPNGQLTPRSVGRFSHQRDCSRSSLGSNGPASPYSHNIPDPHIALNDSVRDNFHAFSDANDLNNYELATPKSFPGPPQAIPAVPKLGRTVSDAYSDGLYSPNFTIASSSSAGHGPLSPSSELFAQRLQAANKQHMSAVNSPVSASSRDRSPFYEGSPLASLPTHDFPSTVGSSQMPFRTLQQMRESKALQEPVMQHMARSSDTSAPQTISPKDAMLEYHEPEGGASFPLFPQQNTNGFNGNAISTATGAQPTQAFDGLPRTHPAFEGLAMGQNTFKYAGSQIPATMQVPQQYSFVAQQRLQSAVPSSVSTGSAPATRLGSADTAATESARGGTPQRPVDTRAGGGTYSCTYQNCTQRFDTPGQLQKHKKEFHRQVHGGLGGGGGARRLPEGDAELNTQAGPHRCDRINPSTGKPCNTVFSRPYDLTRHEDTIHNARKQKVRCEICTDGKTFSRADALTRHLNVKHGIPAEKRRRGAAHAGG